MLGALVAVRRWEEALVQSGVATATAMAMATAMAACRLDFCLCSSDLGASREATGSESAVVRQVQETTAVEWR